MLWPVICRGIPSSRAHICNCHPVWALRQMGPLLGLCQRLLWQLVFCLCWRNQLSRSVRHMCAVWYICVQMKHTAHICLCWRIQLSRSVEVFYCMSWGLWVSSICSVFHLLDLQCISSFLDLQCISYVLRTLGGFLDLQCVSSSSVFHLPTVVHRERKTYVCSVLKDICVKCIERHMCAVYWKTYVCSLFHLPTIVHTHTYAFLSLLIYYTYCVNHRHRQAHT